MKDLYLFYSNFVHNLLAEFFDMLLFCTKGLHRSSAVASLLVIQVRTKISKTSPFGKRTNPTATQREGFMNLRPQIEKMAKSKTLDRPMNLDSPGNG